MKPVVTLLILLAALAVDSIGCETAELIESWNRAGMPLPLEDLGRPVTQQEWPTPDGRFLIHYDITGDNAVYRSDEDIDPADEVPDYVNRTAEYFERAYSVIVMGLGFDEPPSDLGEGGDDRYDIYLTEVPGLTSPENPSEQYPGRPSYTSYIQLGHDLRFPPRYGDDPLPYLRASVAHEFFHAVEFAYRAYSSDQTAWLFESCAHWAEDQVFDDLNDIYYALPFYLVNSRRSLYLTSGPFMYGAWLFPEFLSERHGTEFMRESWEKFASFDFAVNALEFALEENGTTFNAEYLQHVIWNYFTGPNYIGGYYEEGEYFPVSIAPLANHLDYPVDWVVNPVAMGNVSSSYIVFSHRDLAKGGLIIEYYNPNDDRHAVCLAKVYPGNQVVTDIYNIDSGIPSTFIVPDFPRAEKVIMMPVWVYEGSQRFDITGFSYRAYLDTTIVSVDDSGVSPIDGYSLDRAYPNPFNGSVAISFNVPSATLYQVKIYDIGGRSVEQLDGSAHAGQNIINWTSPGSISSGVFFYVIDLESGRLSGKMSLLK